VIPSGGNPTTSQLRQFAWAAPIGFGLLGFMIHRLGAPMLATWIGVGFGLVILVAGVTRPTSIRLVFALLMLLAMPIGWIVSNVFIAIFYYLMLTPLALVFRLFGRDPLWVRTKSGASAWEPRRKHDDAASYYRQG